MKNRRNGKQRHVCHLLLLNNSYYAFLAASAPQLLPFTIQTDKALSSPRFLLSHLHRQLSPLSLSFCRFRNQSVVFFFSSRKRERDMQSVVLNPTCYCRAQQGLDTSCSSPPPPAIPYKVSSFSPCLNFFFSFSLCWRWITESHIHRVVRAFLVPIRGAPVTCGEAYLAVPCEFDRLLSHGGGQVFFLSFLSYINREYI